MISIYLEEIMINVCSILIMLQRNKDAMDMLSKAETFCNKNDLTTTRAKLILIKVSLHLELNEQVEEVQTSLLEASNLFE